MNKAVLTSQRSDFAKWYQEVLAKAELVEHGPVRGTMVIRPYGYRLWELMTAELDTRIRNVGAENVYLPLLIPESFIHKEAQHVEGFDPQVLVATHAGGMPLAERLVIRPTSETLFGEVMARWIHSHRDLPMLLNQWANVVRWELRPRLLLRTTEFLWQEGHTAHADGEEAARFALRVLVDVYRDFLVNVLAVPVRVGRKTAAERFPGAINTLTCEAMMRDGKALQMATSHELGQNFGRAFDISYTGRDGTRHVAWTTSWGSSTRMLGGLIMVHGDDNGLRVPPRVAPIQVVVLVVHEDPAATLRAQQIVTDLRAGGIRASVDAQFHKSFGRRVVDWRLKGVPIHIELGSRELANGTAVVIRRDNTVKQTMDQSQLLGAVHKLLADIQQTMLEHAQSALASATVETSSLDTAIDAAQVGFARVSLALVTGADPSLLAAQAVTVRCIERADGTVPMTEDEPDLFAILARAY